MNEVTEVVGQETAKVMSDGNLSITQLIVDASPLVQGVMLFLLLLSVISWTVIIQRGRYLSYCSRMAKQFENEFWGNIDLNQLYQNCKSKKSLSAMEKIFTAGFTEFARMHKQGVKNKDTLMDGTYRKSVHRSVRYSMGYYECVYSSFCCKECNSGDGGTSDCGSSDCDSDGSFCRYSSCSFLQQICNKSGKAGKSVS